MPSVAVESTDAKRRKISSSTPVKAISSRVFSPFRTIGLVTDGTPLAITSLGQSFLVTTVVDNSFQIYDASNLHLLFVSQPRTPSKITCIHSHFHYVYASWERSVGIYKRGNLQSTIVLPDDHDASEINSILLFGGYLCVSTSETLYVYKSDVKSPANVEFYTSFRVPKVLGQIKHLSHPPTYLNKVVIAAKSSVLVFNVRSGKLLYTSEDFGSSITAVEPSPVLDIVGISTAAGDIHLYNIRRGKIVFSLDIGEHVSSISFRTDGTPHLAVGTASGHLFFYDLNGKRRIHSVRGAHSEASGGVSKVQYLNGQSIVITNGADNIIQELVFDPSITSSVGSERSITSPPRVLRSRGGHARPPTSISFTDEEAHFILSASQDKSLWSFSLRKDSQSHEFSQRTSATTNGKRNAGLAGSGLREKFSEITDLAYQANKQNRWDNIITAHKNLDYARTWSGSRGIVGKYNLHTLDGGIVKSVGISQCGNFGLIGSSQGSIAVYNLQSGTLRRKIVTTSHKKAVTGIASDSFNKVIISCSLEGFVMFHDFHNASRIGKINLESSALQMRFHSRSNLLAVALDNLSVVVIDIQTRRVIRELWGHTNAITSFDFTPDGRWIISASLDSSIRTWDIPSGGCIDAVKVNNIVTCLKVSPNGEWLATSHVQGAGVQLWTMKSQFQKISTRTISEDEVNDIVMPNSTGEGGSNIIEGAFELAQDETDMDQSDWNSPNTLSDKLQTLSLLPKTKLNTLVHLDLIKLRNKPKEAPKVPEKSPFFLGVPGVESERQETSEGPFNQPKMKNTISSESTFTRLLRSGDVEGFLTHLKGLSPSATDLEIRSLNTFPPLNEFISFIDALTYQLQQKRDYELVQAWMTMLLRIHGDIILANQKDSDLIASLSSFETEQDSESVRLDKLTKYCSGVLNYLRTA
ncbi:Utp21p [Sugiyamaella lignohabitans]|uniref:Utp21p n=1 Tax=Sugiyamaella lignohabitans TaxID=796027 RepID=A0A167D827_9ASCO|nr:Utp21p [Sugiyamaella lignohabitans]ANB12594.1 Utp21p [Sugiyamaella lignohabitans]